MAKERYVAVCRDESGNSVKITGLVASGRNDAVRQININFSVRDILAVVTEEDAEFIRRTLNGEDEDEKK